MMKAKRMFGGNEMLRKIDNGLVHSEADWMEYAEEQGWDFFDTEFVEVVKDDKGNWISIEEYGEQCYDWSRR